jgi:predicted Holliday junction resolvase-like endonuclease
MNTVLIMTLVLVVFPMTLLLSYWIISKLYHYLTKEKRQLRAMENEKERNRNYNRAMKQPPRRRTDEQKAVAVFFGQEVI